MPPARWLLHLQPMQVRHLNAAAGSHGGSWASWSLQRLQANWPSQQSVSIPCTELGSTSCWLLQGSTLQVGEFCHLANF